MSLLKIDLQKGFRGDTVCIKAPGSGTICKKNITTNDMLGVAGSLEVLVPDGPVIIEVEIPSRGLSQVISMNISAQAYLGLWIDDGNLGHFVSKDPFIYL